MQLAKVKRFINLHKTRKPYNLKATAPAKVIEFDMKHIYASGHKQYAFVAIDTFTKQTYIHIASTSSSFQAMLTLQLSNREISVTVVTI